MICVSQRDTGTKGERAIGLANCKKVARLSSGESLVFGLTRRKLYATMG